MGTVQIIASVIAFGFTAVAITLFVRACAQILAIIRLGAKDDSRSGNRAQRLKTLAVETLGHTRMLKLSLVGAAHWFVFIGFFSLFPILVQAYFEVLNPNWSLPLLGHFIPWLMLSELIALFTWLGIVTLFIVRMVKLPSRNPAPEDGPASEAGQRKSTSRFEGSSQWQAFYVEATIFAIASFLFLIRSAEYAKGAIETTWASPISAALSNIWGDTSAETLGTVVTLLALGKILVSWTFFVIIARILTMGIGWHRLTAFFNIYYKREADGRVALGAAKPALVDGRPIDFETDDPEKDPFGVGQVEQFTWKGLLDFTTCTECGRCQDQCPAWNTGKPLSPKLLMTDLRTHLYAKAPYLMAGGRKDALGEETASAEQLKDVSPIALAEADKSLIGDIIDPEVLWSCTTCGACVEQCPVDIEHVDHILDMRRNQTMMESAFPPEAGVLLRNLENKGNPWGENPKKRTDWTEGLDFEVPVIDSAAEDYEYLFWVGCAAAFDPKAQKTARAVATLLHQAGVSFATLGKGETCTGDPARRMGNEFLFQMLAEQNVTALNEAGAKKIVATCPHCLNTLGNEYGQMGGHYEVVHHTELLSELLKSGKIKPVRQLEGGLTYHDPCYLGRHNGVFTPPREVLGDISAQGLTEMPRSGKESFCCGAGGARMWMEEDLGKRVNINRSEEAINTGAKTVAVGCPFCSTMINDGVAASGEEENVQVVDVAQLLLEQTKPDPAQAASSEEAAEAEPDKPSS
ncbi:(Fe-S)-binding protein [Natronoglycomyces albus]|uniref:(Fe-S)-binding protein n=1 Tax=Natronoglycomyces albus TaxID=2811108 RepID=A0A895XMW4_9ACTN|nr:(Fe-S)-binding protein [Natronoglycomyces albus]QSB05112.1 (Fe-S)-binding protein [Natronoglycomyces albus]